MDFQIREMDQDDWKDVKRIYQEGMDTNNATFQVVCPSYDEFNTSHVAKCRFVMTDHDIVIGWTALTTVSSRCVYSGVAEVSIYIDAACKRSRWRNSAVDAFSSTIGAGGFLDDTSRYYAREYGQHPFA